MPELPEDLIWSVWSKAEIFGGNDPVFWRKDECGAWIFRSHYDRQDSEYGWVIDHITPISDGGTDDLANLRPLHYQNTTRKPDGSIECRVTSNGIFNGRPIEHTPVEGQILQAYYF